MFFISTDEMKFCGGLWTNGGIEGFRVRLCESPMFLPNGPEQTGCAHIWGEKINAY